MTKPAPTPMTATLTPSALLPALLLLYGAGTFGAVLGGVLGSSAASAVFWMCFPLLPGAAVGLLSRGVFPFGETAELVICLALALLTTIGLAALVTRARTWTRALGLPVIILALAFSFAQALWLMVMMRA